MTPKKESKVCIICKKKCGRMQTDNEGKTYCIYCYTEFVQNVGHKTYVPKRWLYDIEQ